MQFLITNKHLFSLTRAEKRKLKTNVMMSKKVRTRKPIQCHSHHQKMMKKYGSVEEIIEELQSIQKIFAVKEKRGRKKKVLEPVVKQL
jgi:hypothetical protein